MAHETIACLQDNGLEVIVDLEHAMDAGCGRRENGNACEADFRKPDPGLLPPDDRAVRQPEGQPASSSATPPAARARKKSRRVIGGLVARLSRRALRLSRPHRSRPWRRQCARRHSGRRGANSRHADRNRRTLRQREPDDRYRRHAAPRRSGVCTSRIARRADQPGAFDLRGLRA